MLSNLARYPGFKFRSLVLTDINPFGRFYIKRYQQPTIEPDGNILHTVPGKATSAPVAMSLLAIVTLTRRMDTGKSYCA